MTGRPSPRELATGVPAAALAGLLVGVLGTFKHQVGISAATGHGVPVGLVASLGMVALVLIAIRATLPARWFAGAAAVGVVAAVGVLLLPGPGGSRVILPNAAGIVWAVATPLIALAVVVWPGGRRVRRRRWDTGGTAAASEDRTPT